MHMILCEGLSRQRTDMLSEFAVICFQVAAYDESLEVHTGHLTEISPAMDRARLRLATDAE
jgi:hypothetical protein